MFVEQSVIVKITAGPYISNYSKTVTLTAVAPESFVTDPGIGTFKTVNSITLFQVQMG